jgi:hypothetical protein
VGYVTAIEEFDSASERYHLAAADFIKGNPEPYKALFSQGEDVTVANPFFPGRTRLGEGRRPDGTRLLSLERGRDCWL